jgi:signal transduction histidine kinase
MGNHGAASARARVGTAGNSPRQLTAAAADSSRGPRLSVSNWPVSRRLFAVIALALVMGLVFGGLRIASAESSSAQFSRVSQLANLSKQLTVMVEDLQNERDWTMGLLSGQTSKASEAELTSLYGATSSEAATIRQLTAGIGSAFPQNIQNDVTTVNADINIRRIADLHSTLGKPENELAVIGNYGVEIGDMITLADQVAQGTSDASLASDIRALNALSLAKEQVSQQRALLNYSFGTATGPLDNAAAVDPTTELELQIANQEEIADEATFQQTATSAELTFYDDSYATATDVLNVSYAENIENNIFTGTPNASGGFPLLVNVSAAAQPKVSASSVTPHSVLISPPGTTTYAAVSASPAFGNLTQDLAAMQSTETLLADNIVNRAGQLESGAKASALQSIVITAVVLLLVFGAALLVARSLVLPLRRLRASALDIAQVQLPERVRQLSQSPESAENLEIAPIDVLSTDEIGQVARAFDQVHAEAVRLAGDEALLRSNFNAMFINLSRRSQSLIERLARTIDSLEQNEDDPDRLSNLFSMDHMVTRMRRNSENLLLLAGHEGARKWSESVPLADVARAATSEIEQYSRVTLNVQPGVAVIGQAVSDVVHLLAELIENATLYSPKDTPVHVSAQEVMSGGVLIEITDQGIGVSEGRLAEMNWRLDNPPVMDVWVSRHMGLFAVARLAERHQVRVRLRAANPQGMSALVWLPDSVIERTNRLYTGGGTSTGWTQPIPAQAGGGIIAGRRSPGQQRSIATRTALDAQEVNGLSRQDGPIVTQPIERQVSNWFRARRIEATGVGTGSPSRPPAGGNGGYGGNGGNSGSADGGWQYAAASQPGGGQAFGSDPWAESRHAAEIVADPIRGDQTAAGLPVRVPKANLIPGSAGGTPSNAGWGAGSLGGPGAAGGPGAGGVGGDGYQPPTGGPAPLAQRSPDLARSRLSGFQRGARRAEERKASTGEGADR